MTGRTGSPSDRSGDRKGNIVTLDDTFLFFLPARYDLVFTEIMADPSPPVYLPESEYLEFTNRSSHPVCLDGWTVGAGSRDFILEDDTVPPGGYYLVCSRSAGWLYPEGSCSPVFTSSSVLTNNGQLVVLRNTAGEIIDAVQYAASWYGDAFKSEGGWSLERVDNSFLCGGTPNWRASESVEGGTPCKPNSVAGVTSDTRPPFARSVIFDGPGLFRIAFSEPVSGGTGEETDFPLQVSGAGQVVVAGFSGPFHDTLCLMVPDNAGREIRVIFAGPFSDCSGNDAFPRDTFRLGTPVKAGPGDILITEVLYSPFPGCAEYVEVYNRSGKLTALNDLILVVGGTDGGGPNSGVFIAGDAILFPPGAYLVLSSGPETLPNYYDVPDEKALYRLPGMQALGNAGGTVRLMNRSGEIIDEMRYGPDDQYPMISDDHGIALERMTLDAGSGLSAPWHSASSLSGFGTPGYRNSQYLENPEATSSFSADPEVFTPDNDGNGDVAVFRFHFEKEGYVGTMRIFEASGRIVRTLGVNELLGPEGFFQWDGRNDAGQPCGIGIYLGYLEVFHPEGQKKAFRKTVVLARRRN